VNEDDMELSSMVRKWPTFFLEEEKRCPTVQTAQSPTSITLL